MNISNEKWFKELQQDIERWIKKNNWKGGKCRTCGKLLYPIIDFKNICYACMNKKLYGY